MAKIRNSNPKQSGGGYERLVGNTKLASILTKAQSTVISNGTELEKIISSYSHTITNLDNFIECCDNRQIEMGSYLCTKKVLKKSQYNLKGHEPDFLAFSVANANGICYVVELKDGDAFDTKKSVAEKEMLQIFVNHIAPKIPFRTKYYMCSFNQLDKEKIVQGFKNVFSVSEVMTGKEFCDILGVNYEEIVQMRLEDTADNFCYVVEKMTELQEVKDYVVNIFRKHIIEDDFYDETDCELDRDEMDAD